MFENIFKARFGSCVSGEIRLEVLFASSSKWYTNPIWVRLRCLGRPGDISGVEGGVKIDEGREVGEGVKVAMEDDGRGAVCLTVGPIFDVWTEVVGIGSRYF